MLTAMCKEELLVFIHSYYDIILAAVISLGATVLITKALRGVEQGKHAIPGRLGLPFIGETFSFLSATNSTKGCYEFIRLRRLWYGKCFKTRIFGKIHVFVPSTESAKTIFGNDFVKFNKGYVKSMADAVGKNSLLCVPAQSHKRIRRLLSDPFSMNSLSKFVEKFDRMLYERLKELDGKSFVLLDFTMKIAFDAMCDMLMSITDVSMLREIETYCHDIGNAMLSIPVMIPGTRYYKGIKARKRLMALFGEIIERRRKGKECPDDFLQSMVERESYPLEEKLGVEELKDNLLTMIIAGQSTTAAAIMWSIKFLHDNPQVQDKLREEQLTIIRNKLVGDPLTLEDLNSMSYGSKVIKETLRMTNVLLWYPRVALSDCTLEGYEIKKGWHVNIDATFIHTDPSIFKDPLQFNPSRFDEVQRPYSFIPFGAGPRTCLGINMAKVTMLVFLSRLTSGYRWTVDDPDPSLEKKAHIPRLRSGLPITLTALDT